ncbi:MAG: HEAT repeat domain-containing protein, partial [Candidatus Cybelea sp.]
YEIFENFAAYLKEDVERYSRPIVCNTYLAPSDIFDRHLYQKGAVVLHMLRGELGDARFWRAMTRYVRDNAQRSVETIDFVRAIENATGRNLRGFFAQWVFREGHPSLEVRADWDPKRKVVTLTIDQKQTIDTAHPAYQFDVEVGFDDRLVRVRVERGHETITVPVESEPQLVRFDPGGFLLADVTYALGVDFAAAALQREPNVVARIRAGRELARDGGGEARDAIEAAFAREPFWGVLVELAAAIGATRAPWAQTILVGALAHAHPKVVRAAAAALGNFRDGRAASALIATAQRHESYFVRASALTALGKTRDERAYEVLAAAAQERSWNNTVEAGALHGLAELADARAMAPLFEATDPANGEGLRRAAVTALARVAALVEEERGRVADAVERLIDDDALLVALAAISAAESLGDARLLPALDRLGAEAVDGRLRRHAAEAAMHVRKNSKVPTQVKLLRDDIDELREEQHRLQEKIEALARA